LGLNSSPVLTIAPIDLAAVGQTFFHNPGAIDADGDSLSYELTICKKTHDRAVDVYAWPDDPKFDALREDKSGPAKLTLDPLTGDLVWDAPNIPGEYNVAFYVYEWRNGVLIGAVNRDMQIIVRPNKNKRSQIVIPKDTCVIAGSLLRDTIRANDPDRNPVTMQAYGAVFGLKSPSNKATFDTVRSQPPTGRGRGVFRWQTVCEDISRQPYVATFRIEDRPRPESDKLITIKSWRIKVVAPPPENLKAIPDNASRTVKLTWDSYKCKNAEKMTIWRRINSFDFTTANCQTGLPSGAYVKIGEVDVNTQTFTDTNDGKGLDRGKTYCYRIYAVFPEPKGGESYASKEVCVLIPKLVPLMTHVSIEKTDKTQGEILVRWTKPIDIDSTKFPRPYTFRLARAQGNSGTVSYFRFSQIFAEKDTIFTDKSANLNTLDNIYNYRVYFYSNNILIDSSEVAASPRLLTTATATAIKLTWGAEVPWSNRTADYKRHYVYREQLKQKGLFDLIDSVDVAIDGFNYTDLGKYKNTPLELNTQYCYYVMMQGKYDNISKIVKPLRNKTQVACAMIADTLRPKIFVTNVSVLQTDLVDGAIYVRWTKPYNLDQKRFKPPYTYKIARADGFTGTTVKVLPQVFNLNDTVFVDRDELNTEEKVYNYRVYFYSADSLISSSKAASSVRLQATSPSRSVDLTWQATVPWTNNAAKYRWHYIMRERLDQAGFFDLIDSVDVVSKGFKYTDTGKFQNKPLKERQQYCYYIITSGTYNADTLPQPLLNRSQRACAIVKDTTAPCPPVLSLKALDCVELDARRPDNCDPAPLYSNPLNWKPERSAACDPEIVGYKLYYKRYEEEAFKLLMALKDTVYLHDKLASVAGCYSVTALDSQGNESRASNTVCNDNCPSFIMPNVITPNGDGKNDVFVPMNCPRFVEKASLKVYNRWGELIYESIGNEVRWTAVTQSGSAVANGLYYYEVRVTFIRLRPDLTEKVIKGWVEVIR
jgi:gliding motility-associated-like protein